MGATQMSPLKRLSLGVLITLLSSSLRPQPQAAPSQPQAPVILPTLERPTVQERFAPRVRSLNTWAGAVAHIRDDYYTSYGVKMELSYFFNDAWGLDLGLRHLWTSLSDEATLLRDRYGLTPDARPQSWNSSLGLLYGAGYAKALLGPSISHVDPIAGLRLGLTTADERYIPTLELSVMPTILLAHGLKLRLELAGTLQFEQRERGLVVSTGFLPSVTVGWGGTLRELGERFGLSEQAEPEREASAPQPLKPPRDQRP